MWSGIYTEFLFFQEIENDKQNNIQRISSIGGYRKQTEDIFRNSV